VTLNAGANDVHLVATTVNGLSSIDSFAVAGSGVFGAATGN
jgi:hypothetical protein